VNDTTDISKLDIGVLETLADRFARASISESTRTAYESDWLHFYRFCRQHGMADLPADADTVVLYLTAMAESRLSISTISRRCTSITAIHRASGYDSPVKTDKVARVFRGIKRETGKPQNKRKALSWKEVKRIKDLCDSTMIGIRDAAIILLGWTSALRRSELVALNIGDLDISDTGIIVTVARSKTDQDGSGVHVGIPRSIHDPNHCPVLAVENWISRYTAKRNGEKHVEDIPLFAKIGPSGRCRWWSQPEGRLSARTISLIVKRYVSLAGMSPEIYAAHSLRRGLATEAGAVGVPERIISRHTRHRSISVLRGYIEDGTIWHENPLPAIYGSGSSSSSSLE
jgi:integrase